MLLADVFMLVQIFTPEWMAQECSVQVLCFDVTTLVSIFRFWQGQMSRFLAVEYLKRFMAFFSGETHSA